MDGPIERKDGISLVTGARKATAMICHLPSAYEMWDIRGSPLQVNAP